jgi:Cu(I)/Ag(I) efflux system membrane fusion protein
MKIVKKIGFISLLFLVFVACKNQKEGEKEEHQHEEGTYYTCSMDPQVKEDKPGKCPICHMELVQLKKDDSGANEITLSDQQIKLGNISTKLIGESQSSLDADYIGVLSVNQESLKTISARGMGRLEKLYFKTEGDYVNKNQPLYQLYSEDIAIAKQDYYTAFKQMEMPGDFGKNAKNLLAAAKQKLLFFGLSNGQIEAIKKTADISPFTTFYSLESGTISEIMAAEGSYVMEGSPLLKLTNLNSLWLEAQVNVGYAKSLKVGQNAQVSFADFPNKIENSKISFINPEINPDTRLLLVRMVVSNPNLVLKPGMQARIRLNQAKVKGLFIPIDAVMREEKANYIWLEKKKGVYENVMVELGVENNGMIEITSEIDSSKKVVITGAYAIDSEYKFRKGSDPMAGHNM